MLLRAPTVRKSIELQCGHFIENGRKIAKSFMILVFCFRHIPRNSAGLTPLRA